MHLFRPPAGLPSSSSLCLAGASVWSVFHTRGHSWPVPGRELPETVLQACFASPACAGQPWSQPWSICCTEIPLAQHQRTTCRSRSPESARDAACRPAAGPVAAYGAATVVQVRAWRSLALCKCFGLLLPPALSGCFWCAVLPPAQVDLRPACLTPAARVRPGEPGVPRSYRSCAVCSLSSSSQASARGAHARV